ncbi:DUF1648 domain-containing protein [Clostridium paraputrificum]|uniref:DUF1648 domain-containing protein n=1 Tax=Clostridium TaxID=1485 RepID=UPI003D32825F
MSNNYSADNNSKFKIKYSKKERISIFIATLGIVFMIVYILYTWNKIPDRIPTHFGGSGNPDSWGGKISLVVFPIISFLSYSLLVGLSFIPEAYNYSVKITKDNMEYQYHNARELILYLNVEIVLCFGYINWRMIKVALGEATGLGIIFLPIFLVLLFGTTGYKIWKSMKK